MGAVVHRFGQTLGTTRRFLVSDSLYITPFDGYVVNMPTKPTPLRMRVISPEAIRHVMEHPARQTRWSVRELAPLLGCSIGTLSHMRTGARRTIPAQLADRFAEAVGVETAVLFAPDVSTDSDTALSREAV